MALICFTLATATLLAVSGHSASIFQARDVQDTSGFQNVPDFGFNLTSDPALNTTAGPSATNDTNSTLPGFSVTDYKYIDFSRIGYQIFFRKMIDALITLHAFLKLDPLLVQQTKTFIITNKTDDSLNNHTLEVPFDVNMIPVMNLAETSFENIEIPTEHNAEQNYESNTIPLHKPSEISFQNKMLPLKPQVEVYDKNYKIPTLPAIETNTESPFRAFPTESRIPPSVMADKTHNHTKTEELQYFGTTVTPSLENISQNKTIKSKLKDVQKTKVESENIFSKISHAIGSAFHTLTGWIG